MRQQIQFCSSDDGARIAYATAGSGPPLVRAGSWLTHVDMDWRSPVWRHWLEALTRNHTLVRYDLRGSGLSDQDVGDASIDTWVNDLEAVVADLGLERFPLFGMCQGGAIAIAYAARFPHRVSRLILFDSYSCGALAGGGKPQAEQEARSLAQMIEFGWGKDAAAFRELFANLLMPSASSQHVHWLGELQRQTVSPGNAARLWTAFHSLDVQHLAPRISVPTLIVHVRGDCIVPFEEGRRLASLIPHAQFVVLEGDNHILQADDPAWHQFVAEFQRFLAAETGTNGEFGQLTRREQQILNLLARGQTNARIATTLGISDKTVRNHMSSIFAKLGVSARGEAIVRARDAGLG
jgi:pimeloyl-ACP methyl ester carboxylesterase/DNA-binding CsgD family transcriptional regulator